jgi:alpha-beta hydrolase superfamily lysophospholipase
MTVSPTGVIVPSIASAQVADGTNLRTLHWPAEGEAVATALIVHGLGEHAGRYDNVAEPMTEAGIDVHGYDHRGHGGSGGPRNHVERWSILHDDLGERLTALRTQFRDRPLILYGHSLGGLIACGYVLADPARPLPDLLVLSAPGLDDDLPAWKHSLAAMLSGIVPKLRLANGLADGGLSRDPAVRDKADRDPLNTSKSSIRFGAEAFKEQDRVNAVLASIDSMPVPTYVFHGSADPIVPLRATDAFEGMGSTTRHVHDGLRHECHHEPEHEHVLGEVVAWIGVQGVPVRAHAPANHDDDHDSHHAHHAHHAEGHDEAPPPVAV